MSARQNKKQRKGRNNVHQRERTVTTLTEDPNTHYLVPTPSEEPAGAPHMPLSFNNSKMHNIQMGSSSFQMGSGFSYGSTYPPFNSMNPNVQQQQQQQQQPYFGPSKQQQPLPQHQQPQPQSQQPQQQSQVQPVKPALPPGKNDLDILQNLKKIIKDGQHPFFRAIPQPAALASIYMGTISSSQSQSQTQGNRGETPGDSVEGQSTVGTMPSNGDTRDHDNHAVPQPAALASNYMGTTSSQPQPQPQTQRRQGETPGDSTKGQPVAGTVGASGPASPNDIGRRQPPADRGSDRGSGPGSGPTSSRDDRFSPGDNREGDRARRGDWQQSDRDRRPSLQPSSLAFSHDRPQARTADVRGRPLSPAEHRPYDAEFSPSSMRYVESKGPSDDPSGMHVDDRRLSAATIDDRRGRSFHAPDYIPPNRGPRDSRLNPSDSRPQSDSRAPPGNSQGPSVDSRSERVGSGVGPPSRASTADRIVPPQPQAQPSSAADVDDIQSSRASSLRPTDVANQSLGSVASPSEENMVGGGRPDMPLEDYGPRPSLKDRLVPPQSAGRASSEHPGHYGAYPRRSKFYRDRGGSGGGGASFDGPPRPGDRGPSGFGAPPSNGTPIPGGGSQGPPRPFHAHSPPPDGRAAKPLSSPPHRHPFRGPPLGRPMGREDRGNYRAEYDPRRPDVLDDPIARYGDRSYRDFSPPLGEIPRGGGGSGDRGRPGPFPPSPGRAPPGVDISGRRGEWQYQQYPPSLGGPQSWDVEDGWDRSGDRDRFERDVPPRSAGWDYRGEREFIARDGYSSGPPLDDRSYGPGPHNRDTDRSRPPGPYTPPYGRVRPRSSSPVRRTGPGPMDDSRPAMKRPREDFPPSGYYSHAPPPPPPTGNRDGPGPMRRPPGEYPPPPPPPPRSASSGPPPSSASSWPPPPPASGGGGPGSGGPPPGDRDRDYRAGRDGMDFPPPAGYDRPRSPGPMGRHSYGRGGGGGGGYGRGEPRDRGGYGMPPRP